jgi:tRNA 2-thiouridine synthesizing protein C
MKSFLFVLNTPAYSGSAAQESLDMILITAAFEQKVSLLLLNETVFHLKKGQYTQGQRYLKQTKQCKNIGLIYRSLALYDVKNIYVEQEALERTGLNQDDLLLPIKMLDKIGISQLMQKFDFVLNA